MDGAELTEALELLAAAPRGAGLRWAVLRGMLERDPARRLGADEALAMLAGAPPP